MTRVHKLVKRLKDAWDDIVDGVNSVLDMLPGVLEGSIKSAFEKCSSKVAKVFKEIAKLYSERGSASALRAAGGSWNEQVGHRASTQAGLLTKEALEADDEWTGDAADRYGEAITTQGKALTEIKAITDILQTTLNEVASALHVFWIGIKIAFGTYVSLMIGCIVGVASGVGTIPSLSVALTLSVAFLGTVTKLSSDFADTLDEKKAKFEQQSAMDGQFANGDSPSSVAEKMADASVRDGDKSAWTPK